MDENRPSPFAPMGETVFAELANTVFSIVSEMPTPDRSTAAAFPRYLTGEVVADSVALQWPGLYARRWRLPRVVDRFHVPATPETHISCNLRRVELHETRVAVSLAIYLHFTCTFS